MIFSEEKISKTAIKYTKATIKDDVGTIKVFSQCINTSFVHFLSFL